MRDQIRGQVRESLDSSMQSVQHDLDREMRDLQAAEDAVLRFDVIEADPRYEVPLRVRMETSRSGLDVEVVAVREGKSVTGTNRFDRGARRTLNEHLATGGTATLAFGANGDAETYELAPVCSWGRHDDGTPRVSSVSVHEACSMPSDGVTDDGTALDADPTATFSLLADETRLALVRELAAADGPVGFADRCSRVGRSDTGRFNYHLGKLRGTMVERTPAGYVLIDAGEQILDVVVDTPTQ